MNRISAWSHQCWWMSCARPKSATQCTGSKKPSARPCMPTHARGAISARYWRGGPPMDDKMRRIAPSDLLTLRSTPTANMATFSAEEATHPASEPVGEQCAGAGYYKEAVPCGHPHFGVLFPCTCKLAEKERRRIEE